MTKQFKCAICSNYFAEKSSLRKHIDSVHQGNKPFQCEFCDYISSHRGHLNRHIDSFHTGKKKSRLNIFDKETGTILVNEKKTPNLFEKIAKKWMILEHDNDESVSNQDETDEIYIKSEIHEEEKPYKCKICYIEFVSKSNLNRHVKSTHKGEDRVFYSITCKICHKTLKDRNYLKRHIAKVHGKEK